VLRRLDLRGVPAAELAHHLPRPVTADDPEVVASVRAILAGVRQGGDAAVREYTQRFDGVDLDELAVPPSASAAALARIDPTLRRALEAAAEAIRDYHEAGRPPSDLIHERDGIVVRGLVLPVDRAGCYVPGGRAVYPSTVLMTAVPARVAGVPEVVLCVPPDRAGNVPDVVLAAAAIAGVDEVYRIGGAQAVAALAYGTESVRPVDVIVGPGNVYVAVAKREVAGEGRVAVPSSFAGPSEVVVVVDDTTPPEWAAIDVVVQAEHGPDGLAWLVTWDVEVAAAVTAEVERLVADAPRRADIEATLAAGGYAVVVDDAPAAVAVANLVAPEHLELLCDEPDELLPLVRHAGAVFCGPLSPASIGDYVAGPSHVLPTFGSARFGQALGVEDFVKHVHVVTVAKDGFERVGPQVEAIAAAEGLPAHAESIRLRREGGREGRP
jgi:histidinol dehydrogenase